MPYIKGQDKRKELDKITKRILQIGMINGNLNYLLFKLCKEYMKEGESYNAYKNYIGEIEMAKKEIYRRLVAPYEDLKIVENGDVK